MLTELLGKGGQVCQLARAGEIKCPLIVRPTSEDVVTGQLFQVLEAVNPRWWLPQVLNTALGVQRFRQQVFRRLRIDLWKNRPPYPREMLPWNEGSTQVDASISWENPPTTVFFEVKYGSDLAKRTTGDDGTHGYPSDQLIRNIRVGLRECGWFGDGELFSASPRSFVVILLSPESGHPLVQKYRETTTVFDSIPHADRLIGLPPEPFVGEIGYGDLMSVLNGQLRWMSRAERSMVARLIEYLELKRSQLRKASQAPDRQQDLQLA